MQDQIITVIRTYTYGGGYAASETMRGERWRETTQRRREKESQEEEEEAVGTRAGPDRESDGLGGAPLASLAYSTLTKHGYFRFVEFISKK